MKHNKKDFCLNYNFMYLIIEHNIGTYCSVHKSWTKVAYFSLDNDRMLLFFIFNIILVI